MSSTTSTRCVQVITSGGMGVVHRVHHRGWNVDLAVKTPRPELVSSPRRIADFETEAETWVGLGLHPHVVACVYVRRLDGLPRVFAEWVDGGSLADAIEAGRLYEGSRRRGVGPDPRRGDPVRLGSGLRPLPRAGAPGRQTRQRDAHRRLDGQRSPTSGWPRPAPRPAKPPASAPGASVLAGYGGHDPGLLLTRAGQRRPYRQTPAAARAVDSGHRCVVLGDQRVGDVHR